MPKAKQKSDCIDAKTILRRAHLNRDGYYDVGGWDPVRHKQKRRGRAHRIVFEECFGDIPAGMCVMHTCDNRGCVNPEHLRCGTNRENVADRVARCRSARGAKHGRAKLSEDQVMEIRGSRGIYGAMPKLAKKFGCSVQTVYCALYGKNWKHLNASGQATTDHR